MVMNAKPKVAIIELLYHAEVLQNFLQTIDSSKFNFKLFVSYNVHNKLVVPKDIEVEVLYNGQTI